MYQDHYLIWLGVNNRFRPAQPDLGWDIAELHQENPRNHKPDLTPLLQLIIATASIMITVVEYTKPLIQKIPKITSKTVHALKSTTTKIMNTKAIKSTLETYNKLQQGLVETARMMNNNKQETHHE